MYQKLNHGKLFYNVFVCSIFSFKCHVFIVAKCVACIYVGGIPVLIIILISLNMNFFIVLEITFKIIPCKINGHLVTIDNFIFASTFPW